MSKQASTQADYRERVAPKWTSFLPILLIFPTFWLTFAPINLAAGLASGAVITAVVIWLMVALAPVIRIDDQILMVGKAQISRKLIGKAEVIPITEAFAEKGPRLDARAYLALQGSIRGLVKVEITDPSDPTPYWLFSSAHPEEVVASLKL